MDKSDEAIVKTLVEKGLSNEIRKLLMSPSEMVIYNLMQPGEKYNSAKISSQIYSTNDRANVHLRSLWQKGYLSRNDVARGHGGSYVEYWVK